MICWRSERSARPCSDSARCTSIGGAARARARRAPSSASSARPRAPGRLATSKSATVRGRARLFDLGRLAHAMIVLAPAAWRATGRYCFTQELSMPGHTNATAVPTSGPSHLRNACARNRALSGARCRTMFAESALPCAMASDGARCSPDGEVDAEIHLDACHRGEVREREHDLGDRDARDRGVRAGPATTIPG